MNHESMFLTLAIGATLAAAAPASHAEYIPPHLEARLQAAADVSPDRLRMLVWRTRAIYALSMDEVSQHLQSSSPDTGTPETESVDGGDGEGGAPITTPEAGDDAFTREFFRNDARD